MALLRSALLTPWANAWLRPPAWAQARLALELARGPTLGLGLTVARAQTLQLPPELAGAVAPHQAQQRTRARPLARPAALVAGGAPLDDATVRALPRELQPENCRPWT